jgi:hypothetical protein
LEERKRLHPSTIDQFIFPRHPFPWELCLKISKLPAGFREMCLSRVLSMPLIGLVERVTLWAGDYRGANSDIKPQASTSASLNVSHAARCIELLKNPATKIEEQLVAVALLAYCMSRDSSKQIFFLMNSYLQVHCAFLANNVSPRHEWNTWIGMILAATFDGISQMWQLAMKLLGPTRDRSQWVKNLQLCEAYLWSDELSSSLARKIDLA